MASPTVESATPSSGAATVNAVVDYPGAVAAGDTLICIITCDDNETFTFPNEGVDWHTIYHEDAGNSGPTLAVAWRKASGVEGGNSITVQIGGAEEYAAYMIRISDAEDPTTTAPVATAESFGNSATPTPIILTPPGGAKDFLWIAAEGNDDDDATTVWPANMADNNVSRLGATGCNLGIATEQSNALNFTPGAFTIAAAETWEAVTIAVYPKGVTTHNRSITEAFTIRDTISTQKIQGTKVFTRSLTDYFNFTDPLFRQWLDKNYYLEDGFTIKDTYSQVRSTFLYKTLTDRYTLRDTTALFKLGIFYKALADRFTLRDLYNSYRDHGRRINEYFALYDVIDAQKEAGFNIYNRSLTDYFNFNEDYDHYQEHNRYIDEDLTLRDLIIRRTVKALSFDDGINLRDILLRQATWNKILAEALNFTDDGTFSIGGLGVTHNVYLADAFYLKAYFEYEWIGVAQLQESIARYLTRVRYGLTPKQSRAKIRVDA